MTPRPSTALYSPQVLSLALSLAEFPLVEDLVVRGTASSRVCGSRVEIGVATDPGGMVRQIGAKVTACAIGQAAAAIFLQSAPGRSAEDIALGLARIDRWLSGEGLPDWPGMEAIAAARDHPARHGAIVLPWKAALAALSNNRAAD